jgi:hypothetical protein
MAVPAAIKPDAGPDRRRSKERKRVMPGGNGQ